ncbi:unnamed protein product [Cylicostephanus goldi]|uniref:SCP domain-containing protein n=1 Tax=Cylicostephanus goldi TaxID=71465 RepID=A0A3P7LZR8_CYLGO|nr:unnamed protein product [Cylicostephanus goldi]
MCPYNTEMRDIVRKNFTDTHNYRRSQLALGKVPNKNNHYLREASDMIKLEWDCWLERNATEYVRTCPYKESDETERSGIGELHARVPVEGDFKAGALAAVKRWWSIARKVSVDKCIGDDAKFGKELIGGEIKSFTQVRNYDNFVGNNYLIVVCTVA